MPSPVTSQPPEGYEELGEGLAKAVAQGDRSQRWASGLAALAGYSADRARQWTAYYRATHEAELKKLRMQREAKSSKIEALRRKSLAIREQLRSLKPD